jgi:two-component system sensor histidine kinase AlgZ
VTSPPRVLEYRLPKELGYLYLVAPILTAPLLMPGVFYMDLRTALLCIAGSYVPFLGIPAAIHSFYAWVVPRLFARLGIERGHLLVHAGMSAVVAVAMALLIHPLHGVFYPKPSPLGPWLATCVVITWSFVLPAVIVQTLRSRAHEAESRLLEEQKAALKAQIEAIQSRTNPHFLFNALNTIASLIPEEPRLAEATVERLADLLRYALESSRQDQVTLERELGMLTDYLEVQKARFGERLEFTFDVEEDLLDVRIPPLLLQPLVENAVLHGVAARTKGGRVTLAAKRTATTVEIRIDDDGPGPGGSTHRGSGTSLVDLERRIDLVYGPHAHLKTERNERGGFSARIEVPLEALS